MSRPIPPRPGAGAQAARLAEILRVDHAGELAAVHIYRGQRAVMEGAGRSAIGVALGQMEAQEARHLQRFETLLAQHQARPTLLAPLWRAAGYALGVGTALMGERAAHACTEAVEDVIEAHYAGQVAEIGDSAPELAAELSQFRADELGHRDEALAAGALDAPGHGLITGVIRAGCRAAIAISEKI